MILQLWNYKQIHILRHELKLIGNFINIKSSSSSYFYLKLLGRLSLLYLPQWAATDCENIFLFQLNVFGALNELGKYLLLFLYISLCFDFQNKVQIVFNVIIY